MTITVTQECIDRANTARQQNPYQLSNICPIVQALRDLGYDYVCVEYGAATVRRDGARGVAGYEVYSLPSVARAWADDFDDGQAVQPAAFELEAATC